MLSSGARRTTVLGVLAFAVVYVAFARLGLGLGAVNRFATLVWAPSGLALAVLLLAGQRFWPGIWLGAFVINVWTGASWPTAAGIATGNTLEAVLASLALRRWAGFQGSFDRLRHVMGLILPAAVFATMVSATVGVISLTSGHMIPPPRLSETWRAWWLGDMLGILVFAPVLLTWAKPFDVKLTRARLVEAVALVTGLVMSSVAIFFRSSMAPLVPLDDPSVLFPFFVWAAVRFELRGGATATAIASVLAIWGTSRGDGPFVRSSLSDALLALQVFMGCAALTPLVVGGAIADRARAIRARESLVAAVSHDLRNPLNAIQISAAALVRANAEASAARIRRHDEIVGRGVERMTRLVADLSDAAAVDAGRFSVDVEDESAPSLLHEAVEMLRPVASIKTQELIVDAQADVVVVCDRARILQVLSNLIGNAVKFSPEGLKVVVGMTRASPSTARFFVRDQGVGIESAQVKHVFEQYWRVRRAEGGGTGLGLFVAKGIVEAHGGTMRVESTAGSGSTFYFTLPIAAQPSPRRFAARTAARSPR